MPQKICFNMDQKIETHGNKNGARYVGLVESDER